MSTLPHKPYSNRTDSKSSEAVEGQLLERKAGRPPLDWLERGQSQAEQDFFHALKGLPFSWLVFF